MEITRPRHFIKDDGTSIFVNVLLGGGADLKIQSSTPLGNVALMLYGATDETQICTDGLTAPNVSKRGEQTAILDCIRVSCRAKPVDWQY